jgi:hypothetical protein
METSLPPIPFDPQGLVALAFLSALMRYVAGSMIGINSEPHALYLPYGKSDGEAW